MAGSGKPANELKEAITRIHNILNENRQQYNFKEILTYDKYIVENFPTVCVYYESHTEETLSLGKSKSKINLIISAPIWIYTAQISPTFRADETRDVLWSVAELIRANVSLGGWCQKLEVLGASVQPRMRNNGIIGGGRISVVVNKLIWRDRVSSG